MNIFFTSDLHLFHLNIIKYCARPFYGIDDMHQTIITNWNSVVTADDLVYIIGDVGFAHKRKIRSVLEKLNGEKILIKGNHDRKSTIPDDQYQQVWERLHLIADDYNFILTHDPAEASANHMNTQRYLCGHLHSAKQNRVYRNWIDVGIDGNDFFPISLETIIKIFEDETKKKSSVDELL